MGTVAVIEQLPHTSPTPAELEVFAGVKPRNFPFLTVPYLPRYCSARRSISLSAPNPVISVYRVLRLGQLVLAVVCQSRILLIAMRGFSRWEQ